MGVASQNSTLLCSITSFPVSLLLSSPGDVKLSENSKNINNIMYRFNCCERSELLAGRPGGSVGNLETL